MNDGQICCHLTSRGEGRSEGVYQICNPCQPLTLFGWPVPAWLELVAVVGFAALVIGLIVYIAGLSMLWWGPDDDTLIKEWRRERQMHDDPARGGAEGGAGTSGSPIA